LLLELACGLENGPCLHYGNFRINYPKPATSVAKHRIDFVEGLNLVAEFFFRNTHICCKLLYFFVLVRKELVEWRVKRSDSYMVASHCFKDTDKILSLERKEFFKCLFTTTKIISKDHFPHCLDAVRGEEHVLCSAESNAMSTKVSCYLCIKRGISIGADFQPANLVCPLHEHCEIACEFRVFGFKFFAIHFTGASIQRYPVAFFVFFATDFEEFAFCTDSYCTTTNNTAFAHSPADNCGV